VSCHSADLDAYIATLAAVVLPVGEWAVYGGARSVWDLLGPDNTHPDYYAMLDASIDFIRTLGIPFAAVRGYEQMRWSETHSPGEW
jgi:hypothetical protein